MMWKHMQVGIASLIVGLGLEIPVVSAMTCEFKVESNLQYGTGTVTKDNYPVEQAVNTSQVPLLLDAYIPTVCDGKPVTENMKPVGFVHGGGFVTGSKDMGGEDGAGQQEILEGLAKNGYAVFSINYRLFANAKNGLDMPVLESISIESPEIQDLLREVSKTATQGKKIGVRQVLGTLVGVEDAIKAKDWVSANAKRFMIDKDRWGLIGSSAGSGISLGMGYLVDQVGLQSQNLHGVIEFFGTIRPVTAIERGEPDLMIIHGTEDTTAAYEESTKLFNQAKEVGIPVNRITMTGAGHGLVEADVMHRTIAGSDETVFDRILIFLEETLQCGDTDGPVCGSRASSDIATVGAGMSSSGEDLKEMPQALPPKQPTLFQSLWMTIRSWFSPSEGK